MEESHSGLAIIFELVRFLSATALGIFAGGMLTEGCVLVPYWRSLAPAEFLQWYGRHGQRLQAFFGPLTMVMALLALAAALLSLWAGDPGRWLTLGAAIISLVVVATFFVYFGKANASFAQATLAVDNVASELVRWGRWHWWRTGLSFLALGCAMAALWKTD